MGVSSEKYPKLHLVDVMSDTWYPIPPEMNAGMYGIWGSMRSGWNARQKKAFVSEMSKDNCDYAVYTHNDIYNICNIHEIQRTLKLYFYEVWTL